MTDSKLGRAALYGVRAVGALLFHFFGRWVPLVLMNWVLLVILAGGIWGTCASPEAREGSAGAVLGLIRVGANCSSSLLLTALFLVGFPALYWVLIGSVAVRKALAGILAKERPVFEELVTKGLTAGLATVGGDLGASGKVERLGETARRLEESALAQAVSALPIPRFLLPRVARVLRARGPIKTFLQALPRGPVQAEAMAPELARRLVDHGLSAVDGGRSWGLWLAILANVLAFVLVAVL